MGENEKIDDDDDVRHFQNDARFVHSFMSSFIFPERIASAAYTPVKCSNLKSASQQKLTELMKTCRTWLEMIETEVTTVRSFVRSIYYHTTKREYNSKQRVKWRIL